MEARLGLRVSAALRVLVERAGEPSAAARALMLLGAAAAGYDLRAVRADLATEADNPVLAPAVRAALDRLCNKVFANPLNTAPDGVLDQVLRAPAPPEDAMGDPLAGVGFDV